MIKRGKSTTDEISTPFGIRTVSWPVKRKDGDGRFYLNGQPVFINGVCEYEHQFGQSHAFSREQVAARVKQIRAAGFNASVTLTSPITWIIRNIGIRKGSCGGLSSRPMYGMTLRSFVRISRNCSANG